MEPNKQTGYSDIGFAQRLKTLIKKNCFKISWILNSKKNILNDKNGKKLQYMVQRRKKNT